MATFENCKMGCSVMLMSDDVSEVPKFTTGTLLKLIREEGIIRNAHVSFHVVGKRGCYQLSLPIRMVRII
jgi:hypothetical protein